MLQQIKEPQLEIIQRRWAGTVIVAATGPSLTPEVAEVCRGHGAIIAVNDAYKRLPFAPVLYACDALWWKIHEGCPNFEGEKWSSHSEGNNDKFEAARRCGLRLVRGRQGNHFSTDPGYIIYGNNSGFQSVNLAILFGASRVVLVGFDMRQVNSLQHFFGNHPLQLRQSSSYALFIKNFNEAAKAIPEGVEIINATPGSWLKCFPFMGLQEAIDGCPVPVAA